MRASVRASQAPRVSETDLLARSSNAELDAASSAFFRARHSLPSGEAWHESEVPSIPMTHGSRRAMYAALGMFVVSLVLIGAYHAYHQWIMPAPVELGVGGTLELQTPQPVGYVAPALLAHAPTAVLPAAAASTTSVAMVQPAIVPPQPSAAAPAAQDPAATELAPASAPSAAFGPSYEDLLIAGETLSRRGHNREALDAYHRALVLRPDGPEALARVAVVHLNVGEVSLAKSYAEHAVSVDPSNAQAWIALGAALETLGDKPGALTAYRRCAQVGKGAAARECLQLSR